MPGEVLIDAPADGVVRLTIPHPQQRNALDEQLVAHPFTAAMGALEADPHATVAAVGEPHTRELFLLGRAFDAATAPDWGLVNRLVAADEAELMALRQACFAAQDLREGVEAFAAKRAPRWTGR
jgi:enoyl-CoA hydratase/carnithine racemase